MSNDIRSRIAQARHFHIGRHEEPPNLLVMHPDAFHELCGTGRDYYSVALDQQPPHHKRFMDMLICQSPDVPGGFFVAITDQETKK